MSLLDYWRFRAEEMRTIADEVKDAKTKLIMGRVAEDYERIAKLLENGTLKLQTTPLGQTDQPKVVGVVSKAAPPTYSAEDRKSRG
jgi:hypothetical protein